LDVPLSAVPFSERASSSASQPMRLARAACRLCSAIARSSTVVVLIVPIGFLLSLSLPRSPLRRPFRDWARALSAAKRRCSGRCPSVEWLPKPDQSRPDRRAKHGDWRLGPGGLDFGLAAEPRQSGGGRRFLVALLGGQTVSGVGSATANGSEDVAWIGRA